MRGRVKISKFIQVFSCVLFLSFQTDLLAQNQTILTEPYNLPTVKKEKIQSKFNSASLDTGQRSSVAGLASGCGAVEIGNTAAFSTVFIDYKNIDIPIPDIKAIWMPPPPVNPDATINGVDADGDCVRDDIERYIGLLFKDKDDQRKRKYLYEYAKWLGIFIKISHWSVETTKDIAREQYKAAQCVRFSHGTQRSTQQLLDEIFAEFHNTKARSLRYIRNDARLGGWTTREKFSVTCS